MKRFDKLSIFSPITLLLTVFMATSAQAARITVDAAISGYADGFFIDTGNSWDESGPVLPVSEVVIEDIQSANGYTFEYYASANIQTGALKVLTSAVSDPSSTGTASASYLGMPQAFAHIEEDLTFTPANNDPYLVKLSMAVDGNFVLDASTDYLTMARVLMNEYGGPGYSDVSINPVPGVTSQILDVSLTLQGVTDVFVYAALESYLYSIDGGGKSSVFDFSNTAQLSLSLPDGVSVTSSSGMFLSPVPIPGAIWLLGSSLVGLIGLGKKRRSSS